MIFENDTIEKTLKVALAGPPNVGKSTLVNAIIGQKIAITTHKPQTTRSSTLGILTTGDTQIIFADTPGIFEPRKTHKLEKFIVNNAIKSVANVNLILLLVDAYILQKILDTNGEIDEVLQQKLAVYQEASKVLSVQKKEIIIVANKIDTLPEDVLENLSSEQINMLYSVICGREEGNQIISVSALHNKHIDSLIHTIKTYAKVSPWEFDSEQCTNTSERDLAEEITREQLYLVMHAEIPYAVTIDTDSWDENEDGSVTIHQSIIVLKPSQKNMIIGSGGHMIKRIGERARREISVALDFPVHLFLHVKVRSNWIDALRV